jgi:hypothetical protein
MAQAYLPNLVTEAVAFAEALDANGDVGHRTI